MKPIFAWSRGLLHDFASCQREAPRKSRRGERRERDRLIFGKAQTRGLDSWRNLKSFQTAGKKTSIRGNRNLNDSILERVSISVRPIYDTTGMMTKGWKMKELKSLLDRTMAQNYMDI